MQEAMARWKALLGQPDDAWELEDAALLYARTEYPRLEAEEYHQKLDRLADDCRGSIEAASSSEDSAGRLCRHLFEREGFLGNREAYGDPRNSYLNEVIDRRLGIPITLSVLAMAVGRRIGIVFDGIGMPGHFIIGLSDGSAYFDPYAGGLRVSENECRERFQSIYRGQIEWSSHYLDPSPKRLILARMLNNLKQSYLERQEYRRLRPIVEFFLVLMPNSEPDRALLRRLEEWEAHLN